MIVMNFLIKRLHTVIANTSYFESGQAVSSAVIVDEHIFGGENSIEKRY